MSRATAQHDRLVLGALAGGRILTRAEVQRATNLTEHDLSRALRRLTDRGAIGVERNGVARYAKAPGGGASQ